ncbi:MAG: tRNA (adenine(22)-N(1))-methyltransferase TrmK [Clostridiales bacterium]|jgi:tRNA (adenine22-N1)-methyltransferase|nr:tRNA (adenine(22)-N(1))-methyltransferase TrmK [Clostridiales bacterium]
MRVKGIVSEIKYSTLADIGTDHGYIAITAANLKNMKKIIATDINSGPLNNCRANINKFNLGGLIETRLGPGLSKISLNEVESIVIAGMGGNLIIDILRSGAEIAKSCKQLILSPQSNVYGVRKLIYEIGFTIENEKIVLEGGIWYNIISAVNEPGRPYSEMEFYFGKILMEGNLPLLLANATKKLDRLYCLKSKILNNAKIIDENKINSLNYEMDILKNFIEAKGPNDGN